MENNADCPCTSGAAYSRCCHPAHLSRGREALSAEALMRSRYSAFVLKLDAYLLATWHPSTRPSESPADADKRQWLGLKVLSHETTVPGHATVEFIARSRVPGQRAERLHELSRFVFENGQWFYVDGEVRVPSG
ncbi:MAG: YchJ family metal-binding protein [Burkholderiaceae bacterium]